MRRLNTLEAYVNYLARIVRDNGGHAHKNNTLRTIYGQPVAGFGEPWDFEFFGKNCIYCFDCKETKSPRIVIKNFLDKEANRHQAEILRSISHFSLYARCFFLLNFYALDPLYHGSLFSIEAQELYDMRSSKVLTVSPANSHAFDAADLIRECTGIRPSYLPDITTFIRGNSL